MTSEYFDHWDDRDLHPHASSLPDRTEDPIGYAVALCRHCKKAPDPSLRASPEAMDACRDAEMEWYITSLLEDLKPHARAKLEKADWATLMGSPFADVRMAAIRLQGIPREDGMTREDLIEALPPGWESLAVAMSRIVRSYDPPVRIVDAKSKQGELRYALDNQEWKTRREVYRDAARRLDEIRKHSLDLCEECGAYAVPGLPGASGWNRTLCAIHRRERE